MHWLASLFSGIALMLGSFFGWGSHVPASPIQTATPTPASTIPVASKKVAVIPPNATLVKTGDRYDLYLLVNDESTTTGQFFLLDKVAQKKIMLGQPFESTKSELTDFMAASVSELLISADNAYVAFDQGTSVERGYSVFSIATGKELGTFCVLHIPLFWNNKLVYLACDTSNLNTAFEAGAPDIEIANLTTDATSTLVASNMDGKHFFYNLVSLNGNELNYQTTPLSEDSSGTWDFATNTPTNVMLDLAQAISANR